MNGEKVKAFLNKKYVKAALAIIVALTSGILLYTLGNNIGEFVYFITH